MSDSTPTHPPIPHPPATTPPSDPTPTHPPIPRPPATAPAGDRAPSHPIPHPPASAHSGEAESAHHPVPQPPSGYAGTRPLHPESGGQASVDQAHGVPAEDAADHRGRRRDPAERGLRGLVGTGPSQVGVTGAMRARDAARPRPEDIAAAEAELTIVRRYYIPPDGMPPTAGPPTQTPT
jgi:hypothetical protein